jgi:hypothetical protein
MTLPKEQILDIVKNFPAEVDIDEGNVISHADLVQETKSWFQK